MMADGVDPFTQRWQDYMQRKLDHYNNWLSDHKNFSKMYPGYFEKEFEMDVFENIVKVTTGEFEVADHLKATADQSAVSAVSAVGGQVVTRKAVRKAAAVKRESTPRSNSKMVRAQELFATLGGERHATINAFINQLSMTPSGATTYYYTCKKAAV